jgi:hypothetical protein
MRAPHVSRCVLLCVPPRAAHTECSCYGDVAAAHAGIVAATGQRADGADGQATSNNGNDVVVFDDDDDDDDDDDNDDDDSGDVRDDGSRPDSRANGHNGDGVVDDGSRPDSRTSRHSGDGDEQGRAAEASGANIQDKCEMSDDDDELLDVSYAFATSPRKQVPTSVAASTPSLRNGHDVAPLQQCPSAVILDAKALPRDSVSSPTLPATAASVAGTASSSILTEEPAEAMHTTKQAADQLTVVRAEVEAGAAAAQPIAGPRLGQKSHTNGAAAAPERAAASAESRTTDHGEVQSITSSRREEVEMTHASHGAAGPGVKPAATAATRDDIEARGRKRKMDDTAVDDAVGGARTPREYDERGKKEARKWACAVCRPSGPFTMTFDEADACERRHGAENALIASPVTVATTAAAAHGAAQPGHYNSTTFQQQTRADAQVHSVSRECSSDQAETIKGQGSGVGAPAAAEPSSQPQLPKAIVAVDAQPNAAQQQQEVGAAVRGKLPAATVHDNTALTTAQQGVNGYPGVGFTHSTAGAVYWVQQQRISQFQESTAKVLATLTTYCPEVGHTHSCPTSSHCHRCVAHAEMQSLRVKRAPPPPTHTHTLPPHISAHACHVVGLTNKPAHMCSHKGRSVVPWSSSASDHGKARRTVSHLGIEQAQRTFGRCEFTPLHIH